MVLSERELSTWRFVLREAERDLAKASTDWDRGYYTAKINLLETLLRGR
jgi:hypothetical protein